MFGDRLDRGMRPRLHRPQHREALGGDLNAVLTQKGDRFIVHGVGLVPILDRFQTQPGRRPKLSPIRSSPESAMPTNSSPQAAVQLYIQGVTSGDTAALEAAFHSDARMFGALGDQRVDLTIAEMIAMIASQPADVDGSFQATVRSVEEHGDIATAIVDEKNFWGSVDFTDIFSLARIDGDWKIVNKVFTHTGGTPPGA